MILKKYNKNDIKNSIKDEKYKIILHFDISQVKLN